MKFRESELVLQIERVSTVLGEERVAICRGLSRYGAGDHRPDASRNTADLLPHPHIPATQLNTFPLRLIEKERII